MKRTLKRESKVLEIVRREAIGAGGSLFIFGLFSDAAVQEGLQGLESALLVPLALCLSPWRKSCIQFEGRASIGFWWWLTGVRSRARWAGLTAMFCRRALIYLPSWGPRLHTTHVRKGEATVPPWLGPHVGIGNRCLCAYLSLCGVRPSLVG